MPGARTYQAIGFTTYQAGRVWGRRKRAEIERQARLRRQRTAAGLVAAPAVGLCMLAAARSRQAPTI